MSLWRDERGEAEGEGVRWKVRFKRWRRVSFSIARRGRFCARACACACFFSFLDIFFFFLLLPPSSAGLRDGALEAGKRVSISKSASIGETAGSRSEFRLVSAEK